MKIYIESTDKLTIIDGVPVRCWDGTTEDGVECRVLVHRVAVAEGGDTARFDRELVEKLPPCRFVPLALILEGEIRS